MIKKLVFAAALLVPGVAYAANPSAPFSDQVVPAGSDPIACDIGPSYTGSIPAPAVAAGFTHCAANYDFTQASFSNVNNWLQCPDNGGTTANNGTSPALWYATASGYNISPCSDFSIISDNGTQVLDERFTQNDFNNKTGYSQLTTQSHRGEPTPNGTGFPNGMLMEIVVRVPSSTFTSLAPDTRASGGGILMGAPYMNGTNNAFAGKDYIEWDFAELYATNPNPNSYVSTNVGQWCKQGCAGFGLDLTSRPNFQNYATFDILQTLNTSGNFGQCPYINGTAVGTCNAGTFTTTSAALSQIAELILWSGAALSTDQCGTVACAAPTGNVDVYYQRLTVWTCSNWQSTTNGCAGTVYTSAP